MLTKQPFALALLFVALMTHLPSANAQLVNRAVLESVGPADRISLPAPNQRGMFTDDSGARYMFATKNISGSSDCTLNLYRSDNDGLTWTVVTELPDVGIGICQEDVSAQLSSNGCYVHAIWTMRADPTDNPRLAYGAYDLCTDTWNGVEEIRPGVNAFSPDLTLYKKGGVELPIIAYTTIGTGGGRDGWLNFKRTQATWLYPQSSIAYRSSYQDYFLGHSLHQKGATLRYFGSLRTAAGLCPTETQLFGRYLTRSTFIFPPPEFFIHGYMANFQSFFVDPGGDIWICYIAEKDAGCSPGQEIYTLRLPAVGSLVNIYGISDMETGAPFSPDIAGENHYNFAITAVDGQPTVIFSRFADNYEIIYKSTFDGTDFGPATVFYHQPGEQYLRFQTFKEDLDCLQFAAVSSTATGQETVYFSDCGTALRTGTVEQQQDFLVPAGSQLNFPATSGGFSDQQGRLEIFDLQGKLVESQNGNTFYCPSDLKGLYFYRLSIGQEAFSGKIMAQ